MMPELDISIVVPLYNEEESLPSLCGWIEKVMATNEFSYEILLVNDGSSDNSWQIIQELGGQNQAIKGICFMRNYGKSAALHVGFQHCKGRVVITMDADLQDSPEEIPELYQMIVTQGYDLVSGWKKKRYDPITKTIPTKLFNAATRRLSGIELHDFNCGLKAYKQKVIKNIEIYGELHRYIPVIAKWNGFYKIGEKVVEHRAREFGVTKFGMERFVYGFLDLLSITFVSRFGKRPMHFFGSLGTFSFLIGFGIAIWLTTQKIWLLHVNNISTKNIRSVTDQPLFFLALTAIIIGVQLFLAGFLGEIMQLNSPRRHEYKIAEKQNI